MHVREASRITQEAIRNTQDCEAICVQTVQYCLDVGGVHADPTHLRPLQDCADICDTSNKVLLRASPHHADLTAACANICDLCAAACEKFIGDAQMKACANQCRLCASACRQAVSSAIALGNAGFRAAGLTGVAAAYTATGIQSAPVQATR